MSRQQEDAIAALLIWSVGLLIGFGFGYVAGRGKGKIEAYDAIEQRLAIERQSQQGSR